MNYINKKYADLMATAKAYKTQYATADPFPNIYFENFFDEAWLTQVHEEFPDLAKKGDIKFNNPNEVKLASRGEHRFGPKTKQFMHFLNSEPFLMFLQELTGIEEILTPDPYFEGGGYHESKRGGFLKIHADFNKHKKTGLDRRLNVLIYMNKDWEDEWGGHFELWDREMKSCVKKVPPRFNTMAMFTTTDFSYHGLPNPIMCPEDRSRRSLALYYYTNGRPAHEINQGLEDHNTLFKARVGADDNMRKYNQKQGVKGIIKDLTPPLITRLAKKALGKEEIDHR
ncbi:MAG: 2OG-Fe(II) oxygenase [Bacteroidota bacterium]